MSLQWTVMDTPPVPTDQKVGGSSPSERADIFPGQRLVLVFRARR
jgi:hypothetical protein